MSSTAVVGFVPDYCYGEKIEDIRLVGCVAYKTIYCIYSYLNICNGRIFFITSIHSEKALLTDCCSSVDVWMRMDGHDSCKPWLCKNVLRAVEVVSYQMASNLGPERMCFIASYSRIQCDCSHTPISETQD